MHLDLHRLLDLHERFAQVVLDQFKQLCGATAFGNVPGESGEAEKVRGGPTFAARTSTPTRRPSLKVEDDLWKLISVIELNRDRGSPTDGSRPVRYM